MTVFNWLISLILAHEKHVVRVLNKDEIQKFYGHKDSWAIVTGGLDGIGFAYCQNLAA